MRSATAPDEAVPDRRQPPPHPKRTPPKARSTHRRTLKLRSSSKCPVGVVEDVENTGPRVTYRTDRRIVRSESPPNAQNMKTVANSAYAVTRCVVGQIWISSAFEPEASVLPRSNSVEDSDEDGDLHRRSAFRLSTCELAAWNNHNQKCLKSG